MLFALDIQVAHGNRDCQGRRNQEDRFENECEAIDANHSVEAVDPGQVLQGPEVERPVHAHELGAQRDQGEPDSSQ